MKKLFFSAIAFGIFQLSSAQSFTTFNGTDRYIEVKVSDTMNVAADIIKVKIELPKTEEDDYGWDDDDYQDDYSYEYAEPVLLDKKSKKKGGSTPPPPPPPPPAPIYEEVEEAVEVNYKDSISAYLDSKKIAFVFHEPTGEVANPFSKEFGLKENSFELVLNSAEQLEEVKTALSNLEGVKVSVTGAETSKKYEYELALIEKLMKKANGEAGVIAKSMGVQLEKALNVTNITLDNIYSSMFNDPNSMGGMGALFSMMGNLFKSQDGATNVVITKSLVVRFGIK